LRSGGYHRVLHQEAAGTSRMTSRRQRRVADLLQEEISDLVARQLQDPRLSLVTITHVEVSPDLHLARVYFSTLDEADQPQALEALQHAAGFLRRELGARVRLRFTPQLEFHIDRALARSLRLEELLDQLHQDDEQG
ncbi:MAG: 30S ribosome-binding factor RbfA, partial [Chloroflexi bacterium]|nr:30S ribosome-binding factor RbfA [Chloroflexota bacterium]